MKPGLPQPVTNFKFGVIEGAGVSGLGGVVATNVLDAIFPEKGESDWISLIHKFDDSDACYLGHQFACVLASVTPENMNAALANLFRLMDNCAKGRKSQFQ